MALSDPVPVSESEMLGQEDEVQWDDEPRRETQEAPAPSKSPEEFAQEDYLTSQREPLAEPRAVNPPHPRETTTSRREPSSPRPTERGSEHLETRRLASVSLTHWVRNHKNALLFLSVLGVVLGAVAFRAWRSRWQDLPRIAELGRVDGLTALDDGKFDRANQILSEAKRAVIALNDACQGAAAIRQGADEAAIIAGLAPSSLEEMLDEASRLGSLDWQEKFKTLYQGRSAILDVFITNTPDGQGKGRYEFDYRIFRKGGEGETPRSHGRIDTTGLKRLELIRPRVGDHVTLGVRLASFRYDLEREQWLVGLEPESGVIMTHLKALEALGWPSADESTVEATP